MTEPRDRVQVDITEYVTTLVDLAARQVIETHEARCPVHKISAAVEALAKRQKCLEITLWKLIAYATGAGFAGAGTFRALNMLF